jgi:hypothetical protein
MNHFILATTGQVDHETDLVDAATQFGLLRHLRVRDNMSAVGAQRL